MLDLFGIVNVKLNGLMRDWSVILQILNLKKMVIRGDDDSF